jgi:ribonucleoside-diphosphate reductase alpha chain
MMATVRCDHPDIEEFIRSKRALGQLTKFNISVLITDDFIEAVSDGASWPLRHHGQVYRTVAAADLWRQIMETTYEYSEPGVIFIDRMNTLNNLGYCETIVGTNSCGEVPLPHYGSCPLASINLARLVEHPFQPCARLNIGKLRHLVRVGVRLLDNVLDITCYPLKAQRVEANAKRRIGLGITGLANALTMCGATYGTNDAGGLMSTWLEHFRTEAYLASAELADERGSFPLYNPNWHLAALERRNFPEYVMQVIEKKGLRNGALTAIAPTGTMSMLAGNISSGIEPTFSLTTSRRIVRNDGQPEDICLQDFAYQLHRQRVGESARLPESFITANQLTPSQHLATQALAQQYIDGSISKTINCPENMPYSLLEDIYLQAYRLGCKGCATYRFNPVRGSVLASHA